MLGLPLTLPAPSLPATTASTATCVPAEGGGGRQSAGLVEFLAAAAKHCSMLEYLCAYRLVSLSRPLPPSALLQQYRTLPPHRPTRR